MINTLFSMHDIKYIISVDDCFSAHKREEMAAVVYSMMCSSMDPFKTVLSSCNRTEAVAEIDEMLKIGIDASVLIHALLKDLSDEELLNCYEICNQKRVPYVEERDMITSFLDDMKSDGHIVDYLTFSSTAEANAFNAQEAGMADGAILWLLDRDFRRVGESPDSGLELAENILSREDTTRNYIYILSAIEHAAGQTEDDIEEEFDKVLSSHCPFEKQSFIYYISKSRLHTKDLNKIAISLAQGFKRKVCFELFQMLNDCLSDGVSIVSTKIQGIRQKTLNYLFFDITATKGESFTEMAARLVQIFHQDEYNREIGERHNMVAEKARYYEKLCSAVTSSVADERAVTSILKEYRDVELYNKHVNTQHCEITTGDIFRIGQAYYLLVSQACDTYLRSDGHRKLEFASLLEIKDNHQSKFSYSLSCFLEMKKPSVVFRKLLILPFDILDLCVFNSNGQSSIILNDFSSFSEQLDSYTSNYRKRFENVLETVKTIHENKATVDSFFSGKTSITIEDAKKAYEFLETIDPNLKGYDNADVAISFPVQRIARLNELTTIDIVNNYGIALSRIGHPFDFSGKEHNCEETEQSL